MGVSDERRRLRRLRELITQFERSVVPTLADKRSRAKALGFISALREVINEPAFIPPKRVNNYYTPDTPLLPDEEQNKMNQRNIIEIKNRRGRGKTSTPSEIGTNPLSEDTKG
jgi:hypothetical protein